LRLFLIISKIGRKTSQLASNLYL